MTPADAISVARSAEAAGFATGWVSDHFFLDPSRYGGPSSASPALECWTTMTAVAASTRRLRVGSLVLCEAFRPPGALAKMVATLDVLSGGRVEVGLGAGWLEAEYEAHGFAFDPPGQRLARLEDYARIVGGMLAVSPFSYAGAHYAVRDAPCVPGPVQRPRPPVWIGGKGDRLLRIVARVGDGWNTVWRVGLDDYRARLDVLSRACDAVGRDPASVRRS
ncbi:MAG: TIGR03619 family F420-dependent LLM class oxidoreductase, partial [Mycobacteriales bacterium]